jgi:hypothetical protein
MADAAPFPYDGPEHLRGPLAAALSRVVAPEISMNIVDVGLVHGVTVNAAMAHVRITMISDPLRAAGASLNAAAIAFLAVTVAGAAVAWRIQHGAEGARKTR